MAKPPVLPTLPPLTPQIFLTSPSAGATFNGGTQPDIIAVSGSVSLTCEAAGGECGLGRITGVTVKIGSSPASAATLQLDGSPAPGTEQSGRWHFSGSPASADASGTTITATVTMLELPHRSVATATTSVVVNILNPNPSPFFRLVSVQSGFHFYTDSAAERDSAVVQAGFSSEGEACLVFSSPAPGTVPLHRLRSTRTGDHLFTTSDAERNIAITQDGYLSEGEACFVFAAQAAATVPLHRLRGTINGDHFYTTSDSERDTAIAQDGYTSEGEACFVFQVS